MRDWATLLQLGVTAGDLNGKAIDVVGFVTPHRDRPEVFYVSRFTVTCCAVDALPVGVPVLDRGWRDRWRDGQWVRVRGTFTADTGDAVAPVVDPESVEAVEEPREPYEY